MNVNHGFYAKNERHASFYLTFQSKYLKRRTQLIFYSLLFDDFTTAR